MKDGCQVKQIISLIIVKSSPSTGNFTLSPYTSGLYPLSLTFFMLFVNLSHFLS
ncbi:hypothetical protein D1BOALGB6SA_776 [Olavius sp. associated proteobacterium Delta 1]|nr:hypothetical protein D1BOALGB6SA_776 [Olavius sp. associated proteobacterium Delta 1]